MSKDAVINIKGIEGYKMPLSEKEFQTIEETDSEDDDDDDADDDDDDDDEFEESNSESDSDSK